MNFSPDYSSRRFLIVDDDPFMLLTIERMLKECNAGLIVKETDGGKALRAIKHKSTSFDCIIADFNMKPINGLQLLKAIRLGVNPMISRGQRVIMLTGNSDTDVMHSARALDVNGYVAKPVTPNYLYQTINAVLRCPEKVEQADIYRRLILPASAVK